MGIFDKFFGFIDPKTFAPILAGFYALVGFVFMILSFGRCKFLFMSLFSYMQGKSVCFCSELVMISFVRGLNSARMGGRGLFVSRETT